MQFHGFLPSSYTAGSSSKNEGHYKTDGYTPKGTEIFSVLDQQCDNEEEEEYFDEEYDEEEAKSSEPIQEWEEPKIEDPCAIKSEMENLFGKEGASEILALETAMQLRFEKERDKNNAQLWPCLPLNMVFD